MHLLRCILLGFIVAVELRAQSHTTPSQPDCDCALHIAGPSACARACASRRRRWCCLRISQCPAARYARVWFDSPCWRCECAGGGGARECGASGLESINSAEQATRESEFGAGCASPEKEGLLNSQRGSGEEKGVSKAATRVWRCAVRSSSVAVPTTVSPRRPQCAPFALVCRAVQQCLDGHKHEENSVARGARGIDQSRSIVSAKRPSSLFVCVFG